MPLVHALEIIARRPDDITRPNCKASLERVCGLLEMIGDDKFSQKVRNLKSHDTFERKGLATFANGRYKITALGETIARSGKAVMAALSDQGFPENQKSEALDRGFEDIAIEEGSMVEVSV